MKREQKNEELIIAILEIMAVEGTITEKEKQYIKQCSDFNEAKELAQGLKERRK